MLSDSIKFTIEVECEHKLPFLDTLVRRTESSFEYSVYRKPINKNGLHFFSFHAIKNRKWVMRGSCLQAFQVCSPINLNSEIQFLHTIFIKLGYPKHLIDQVLSVTKKKFWNPPLPLDIEEPSATLVLPYNSSLK